MSKYINVEWLKQNFNTVFWSQITKTIDSAPSIDIVRCGECKYWLDGSGLCKHWSKLYGSVLTKADDFCSYGERNEQMDIFINLCFIGFLLYAWEYLMNSR